MKKNAQSAFPAVYPDFHLKSWIALSVLSALAYLPFFFNFLWGNHDWSWIKENTPLWSGVFEGRFSQFFLQTLLFDGQILPILTLLCGITAFSGAAVILFNLWDIPHKKYAFILLGLNLTASPYTLSWLYFAFITLSCLSWGIFIIGGFWMLERQPPKISVPIATVLFTLALGGYPPVINLISTILFSLILIDICFRQIPPKNILQKYNTHILTIGLSLICFLGIQYILKKLGLQYDTYNTAGITLGELAGKIQTLLSALIKQFTFSTSFISAAYKTLWLAVVLSAILLLLRNTPKHLYNLLSFFAAVLGLVCSPLITMFAAENTLYVLFEPRIDFFGLIYIYIFSAAVLLKSPHLIVRNICCTLLTLLLLYNFNTISYAAKIWKSGFIAETGLMTRFLTKLEENPQFSINQKYTFVQGGTLDFRSRYYLPQNNDRADSYTLTAPYIPWHLPTKAYKFYYPQDIFGTDFDIFWNFVDADQLHLTPELIEYLNDKAVPWPQSNAIFINNNTIILTLTPQGKTQAKAWINRQ